MSAAPLGAVEIARALRRPDPTPEQVEVIQAPLAPQLVVAGAGSGKTETMASRVVWLVANGLVDPDQVLGLTFTRKAAGELADRIRSRLRGLRRSGLWAPEHESDADVGVWTYHSYAGRLVREHGLRFGIEPEARLLTEAACWQLASEVVERWSGPMDEITYLPGTVVTEVLRLSGELAEHLVELDDLDAHLTALSTSLEPLPYKDGSTRRYARVIELDQQLVARRRLLPIVAAYRALKRERDSLDFGDQLAIAARLAQQVPTLAAAERDRARAVLLDEFQDTSHAQLVMLRALFGAGHGVTAVGDPHQSIYGWRGASADTLAAFADGFAASGCVVQARHLSTSWRNATSVLAAANLLAAPLASGTRVPVRSLSARPGADAGAVQVATYPTSAAEAAAVADWLAERFLGADGRPVSGATAAVLCRRRAQFTEVEAALLTRGLPYQVVGLGGLLSTPEVADLLAALHVVHDPTRGDLLVRLLTGPTVRLGPHDLVVLGAWARELHRRRSQLAGGRAARDPSAPGDSRESLDPTGSAGTTPAETPPEPVVVVADEVDESSLVEALDELPPPTWCDRDGRVLSAPARTRLTRFADTLRDLRGRTALALSDLVVEVERALLLDVELASRPDVGRAQARAHLDALADVAAGFETSADRATLSAFLAWLAAADEQEHGLEPGQVDVAPDVVQVMTVHAAKGLEWDVVAVPGMVEASFPQHTGRARIGPDGWALPTVRARGWLGSIGAVPHALRGDRASLPDVRWSALVDQVGLQAELDDLAIAAGRHQVAEERRLAYVALTRARHELLLSAHVWGSAQNARVPSRFLLELAPELGAGVLADGLPGAPGAALSPGSAPAPGSALSLRVGPVEPVPPVDTLKPDDERSAPVPWPVDPLGARRPAVERAAQRLRELTGGPEPVAVGGPAPGAVGGPAPGDDEIALLLAERDRGRDREVEAVLPSHISASRLVALREDPAALALALRRPVPREPVPAARRGTAFHAWVEAFLGSAAIVDVTDLPGAADEDPAADAQLERLKARFLATEWAHRQVLAVEVALETPIDGTVVRGRVDAVFARSDGGVDVVDWKTGVEPTGEAAAARSVQLAAYRLAWHRLHDVPLHQVGAAFVYVATGRTVRPADLLDETGLVELLRRADGAGSAP